MTIEKWSALGAFTLAIAGGAVAPSLKALATDTQILGGAIDPTAAADRNVYSVWQLRARFGVAPAAGGFCALYFIPAADGADYADGDLAAPPATHFMGSFPVRAVTTQQVVALWPVILPPFPFKPLIVNKSGQTMSAVDDENQLHCRPWNGEGV